MALVVYETGDTDHQIGVRRGPDIVPVDSLSGGEGVEGVTDCLPLIKSLESQASAVLSDTPESVDIHSVSKAKLHSPIDPSKIIRIEGSYEHDLVDENYNPFIDTEGLRERDWPRFWVAPMSAVVQATNSFVLPKFANEAKPGVELALVIGTSGKYWSPEEAAEAIAGCLVMIDIGIHDSLPGQWGYRFFDSAMAFGTDLVSYRGIEISSLDLTLELNGEVVDTKSTEGWRFSPGEMVSTVSEIMSIQVGDVITTGNPMRVDGTVDPGDELRATIEDIGTSEIPIRLEQTDSRMLI